MPLGSGQRYLFPYLRLLHRGTLSPVMGDGVEIEAAGKDLRHGLYLMCIITLHAAVRPQAGTILPKGNYLLNGDSPDEALIYNLVTGGR